jgi:hypothetical protein
MEQIIQEQELIHSGVVNTVAACNWSKKIEFQF